MARIKGAMMTRKRRNKTLKARKGLFWCKEQALQDGKTGRYEVWQLCICWKKAEEERIPSALDHQNFCCMQAEWH